MLFQFLLHWQCFSAVQHTAPRTIALPPHKKESVVRGQNRQLHVYLFQPDGILATIASSVPLSILFMSPRQQLIPRETHY